MNIFSKYSIPFIVAIIMLISEWAGNELFAQTTQKIAFVSSRDGNKDIYIMNVDGSEQKRLTNNPEPDEDPIWSPDGKQILYRSLRNDKWQIYLMNADGSGRKNVTNNSLNNYNIVLSPDGSHFLYSATQSDKVFSSSVIHQIYIGDINGTYNYQLTKASSSVWPNDWYNDGEKILFSSRSGDIYSMKVDGTEQINLTNNPSIDGSPIYSPDGSKILFTSERDGDREIYLMNSDGSNQTRLTNSKGLDYYANWSPDGVKISFVSNRDGNFEIYLMNSDGSLQHKLIENSDPNGSPTWSSDSKYIIYDSNRNGNFNIYKINIENRQVTLLTTNSENNTNPVIQPLNNNSFEIKYDISKILSAINEKDQKTNPNTQKGKVDINLIPWSEFSDASKINSKSLNSKILVTYNSDSSTGYAITRMDNSPIIFGPGSTFSEGTKAEFITGSAKNGVLDNQFFAVIGIGTEIKLPSAWIEIGGIKFRNGMIQINKEGILLSNGAEKFIDLNDKEGNEIIAHSIGYVLKNTKTENPYLVKGIGKMQTILSLNNNEIVLIEPTVWIFGSVPSELANEVKQNGAYYKNGEEWKFIKFIDPKLSPEEAATLFGISSKNTILIVKSF